MAKVAISIAIPTHEMRNKDFFFKRALDSLWKQSLQDFEVIVTDNSDDEVIHNICDFYFTGITYIRNFNKGMAPNTNEAIKRSRGKLIKILYMDDYLNHEKSLQDIVKAFKGHWLVTDCVHFDGEKFFNHHNPSYNKEIHLGKNTIGSPSVLTIKNDEPLLFDETMTWLLDCDLYKRYYERYGEPVVLNDRNVVIGVGEHQMTHILSNQEKLSEHVYMSKKYAI